MLRDHMCRDHKKKQREPGPTALVHRLLEPVRKHRAAVLQVSTQEKEDTAWRTMPSVISWDVQLTD